MMLARLPLLPDIGKEDRGHGEYGRLSMTARDAL